MARIAQLKKTSEERCLEAFDKWYARLNIRPGAQDYETDLDHQAYQLAWLACWKHLEARLLEEIQS